MEVTKINVIDIARIVDYYCNTYIYMDLTDNEVLAAIQKNPYFWKPIAEAFSDGELVEKKKEIFYVVEIRFGIQFPNSYKKLLWDNSSCTFEEVASTINAVRILDSKANK